MSAHQPECVLLPGHAMLGTFCIDEDGDRILDYTPAFNAPKASRFRAEVIGSIRASLETEFDAYERALLTDIVERAAGKDPYITRHVWDQIYKQMRDKVDADKAHFLTTCLQYHGLDIS